MSLDALFNSLESLESFYWGYIGFVAVIAAGLYFSFRSGFYQLKVLAHPIKTIKAVQKSAEGGSGISPFRVYFASVGGMVGLGNIVGVVTAVMLGGPGALFWLWIAAICGMLIKYAEIYLGMKFRINDGKSGHHGGPMVYLQRAFQNKFLARTIPILYCSLLAIYGVEIFQFVVVADVVTEATSLSRPLVIALLLGITLYGGLGGVRRLANIASTLMPPFIVGYIGICLYILSLHTTSVPSALFDVFKAAFTGHAALGGFAGSSVMMAIQFGTARAVYSGDLGIGYDSIIQSESKAQDPGTQACLSIFGVATDALICTMSILVVLVTGVWQTSIDPSHAVSTAMSTYIPFMETFMTLLIFLAGYSTIIAYLTVGEKAMQWLFPKWGRGIYFVYAILAFVAFSYLDQTRVMTIMSLSGGLIMVTNLIGIWKLRHEIKFKGLEAP